MNETLYKHVLSLQGVRHPVTNYYGLLKAREYIIGELNALGIDAVSEPFYVDGFDKPFYNIEANIVTNADLPMLLLGSHYDTVSVSPGANDNASGTAAMLYCAKIFKEMEASVNVKLLFFTLEENDPVYESVAYEKSKSLNIKDNNNNFTKLRYKEDSKMFSMAFAASKGEANSYGQQYINAFKSVEESLSPEMKELYSALIERAKEYTDPMGFGQRALIGSTRWVEDNIDKYYNILGIIDLDSIAYSSSQRHSHKMQEGIDENTFPNYKVDFEKSIGNFIVFISNLNTDFITEKLTENAKSMDLPYLHVPCPYDYNTTAQYSPELLLADHAAFWKNKIPCVFITDTGGEMRYFYEHTRSDTIDKLNFDFFENVVEVLISSIKSIYDAKE